MKKNTNRIIWQRKGRRDRTLHVKKTRKSKTEKKRKRSNQKQKEIIVPNQRDRKKPNIKMGTWNVMCINGKKEEIIKEIKPYNLDFLGITEAEKKDTGSMEMKDGYWLY